MRKYNTTKLKTILCYFLGFATGILFLISEKDNMVVRFHAMQSTITFGALYLAMLFLYELPVVGGLILICLRIVAVLLWVFLMIKAYRQEVYKLPYIGNLSEKQIGKSVSAK